MDEDDGFVEGDFDTMVRLDICHLVNDMAERAANTGSKAFDTPEQFIAAAESLEHYNTKGGTIEFNCADTLRKTVRGD